MQAKDYVVGTMYPYGRLMEKKEFVTHSGFELMITLVFEHDRHRMTTTKYADEIVTCPCFVCTTQEKEPRTNKDAVTVHAEEIPSGQNHRRH